MFLADKKRGNGKNKKQIPGKNKKGIFPAYWNRKENKTEIRKGETVLPEPSIKKMMVNAKNIIAVLAAVMLGTAEISGAAAPVTVSAAETAETAEEAAVYEESAGEDTGKTAKAAEEEPENQQDAEDPVFYDAETEGEEDTERASALALEEDTTPVSEKPDAENTGEDTRETAEEKEWEFRFEDCAVLVSGLFTGEGACDVVQYSEEEAYGLLDESPDKEKMKETDVLYSAEAAFQPLDAAAENGVCISVSGEKIEEALKDERPVTVFILDKSGRLQKAETKTEEGKAAFKVSDPCVFFVTAPKPPQEPVEEESAEYLGEDKEPEAQEIETKEKNRESADKNDSGIYRTTAGNGNPANISVVSHTDVPIKETDNIEAEEGLNVEYAFYIGSSAADTKRRVAKAEEKESVQIEASLSGSAEVLPGQKIVLYSITDGRLGAPVSDGLSPEAGIYDMPESADGIAVVTDTGFRRKAVELEAGKSTVCLNGMMPVGADARAEEVSEGTEAVKNKGSLIAACDITISDGNADYQPEEENPIRVTIRNDEISEDKNIEVWHITDDGEAARVYGVATEDGSVCFDAYGFSVYAVINGPEYIHIETENAETLQEIAENCTENRFCMYVTRSGNDIFFSDSVNAQPSKQVIITTDANGAAGYVFEPADTAGRYRICTYIDGTPYYITNPGGNYAGLSEDASSACVFDISETGTGRFYLKAAGSSRYLQYSNGGGGFRFWTDNKNAENSSIALAYMSSIKLPDDIYGFDGKSYGILRYDAGTYGEALMAEAASENTLSSLRMKVRVPMYEDEGLYLTHDSDITMWTFISDGSDRYKICTAVNGERKYLKIEGNALKLSDETGASSIRVVPGQGENAGKILLSADGKKVSFDGNGAFRVSDADEWLSIAQLSDKTEDSFIVYSAQKVSVSDTENVTNGTKLVLYTRVWNEEKKDYDYYAVDHDGSLVKCTETSDSIEWIGERLNTILWEFTEYYKEGTDTPNYYYDLKNPYGNKYLAPQIRDSQVLSDSPIGLNLNGRRYGDYHTKIVAWDDIYYTYAGLRANADNSALEPCPMPQGADFYFAVIQDRENEGLTAVPTLDNGDHGITMRMVNFPSSALQNSVLGSEAGGMNAPPTQGLLKDSLGEDGYPQAAITGRSFEELFGNASEVNHLFISSVYDGTGYYSFDSTQNFAKLEGDGNFTVYNELGTVDGSVKPSLRHGQFLPYNSIKAGSYASKNPENLYDAMMQPLDDSDPRKYEKLHLIKNPDYYFGMEITASFVQTPNGLDAWGHDIIYRFSGDDDFWLFVDGELVIDLGGIHSALSGSVNYCTGKVVVNGAETDLRTIFKKHYKNAHPTASDADIESYLGDIFEPGSSVFRDYSTHTMNIYFMERGAGASNLNMHFNLSSVGHGKVELSKKITGTDKPDYQLAEYPFQVWYRINEAEPFHRLTEVSGSEPNVRHINSNMPAKYMASYTPAGGTAVYNDVFFIGAQDTVTITLPDETLDYYITECGISSDVYDRVSVNEEEVAGTPAGDGNRKDYRSPASSVAERRRIVYENHVNENAIRTLTVTKKLYEANGTTQIMDDPTGFHFRLYLGNENETDLRPAAFQEYCVKDSAGMYCRWNAQEQRFEPMEKTDYGSLTQTEKEQAVFQTSINGSISKIPAGYKVEVRDLLVGTRFMVEERPDEIPAGYALIGYERDADSYIIEQGDRENAGMIRDNQSPAVEIKNKRGSGITVKKEWSDSAFMEGYEGIFVALYAGDTFVPGTVRQILYPDTSVYYYFDSVPGGTDLENCHAAEVILEGDPITDDKGAVSGYSSVIPVSAGDTVTVNAVSKETHETEPREYYVSYKAGAPEGYADNVKTDIVRNTGSGVKLVKTDWTGQTLLPGAEFVITDEDGNIVGKDSFISDENGLIAEACLEAGKPYTLTETSAPAGYMAAEDPLIFKTDAYGAVTVISGGEYCSVMQPSENGPACIAIKNRPAALRVIKKDGASGLPLEGAHFSLYKETSVNGQTGMMRDPVPGFSDLVSAADGTISGIDETLPAGCYYLKETSAPDTYDRLETPVRFEISRTGAVVLTPHDSAFLDVKTGDDGKTVYTLTVENTSFAKLVIEKKVQGNLGNRAEQFEFRLEEVEGEEPGTAYRWKKDGEGTEGVMTTEEGEGIFTLRDGEKITLFVPRGKRIKISEKPAGYTTTWELNGQAPSGGREKTVIVERDSVLLVTNTRNGLIPSGIFTARTVFPILAAVLAASYIIIRRRPGRPS